MFKPFIKQLYRLIYKNSRGFLTFSLIVFKRLYNINSGSEFSELSTFSGTGLSSALIVVGVGYNIVILSATHHSRQ